MFPNLEAEMARYKLNQCDLANIVGVNAKTLSNKMNGKTGFTLKEMRKIQVFFSDVKTMTLDYLFEKENGVA